MNKGIVKKGYDTAAENYVTERDQFKNDFYLEKLSEILPKGSSVLDIGCGAGIPIDRFLIDKGYKVMGIDISEKMIEFAKKNIPEATYKIEDMMDLQEKEYEVNAVVSFYAIFHTPREDHEKIFNVIGSFLSKGGLILVTMGSNEWEGEKENFYGVPMWWSHYGTEENKKIIASAGFEILLDEIDTSGNERHQVVFAKKQ